MPYTRNTRIRHVKKLHNSSYTAQVEYRYPFTKITQWEDIAEVRYGPLFWWEFFKDFEGNLAWQADRDCIHDPELEEVKGLEWAKAQIDRYHELYDEYEAGTTVEYIKYP